MMQAPNGEIDRIVQSATALQKAAQEAHQAAKGYFLRAAELAAIEAYRAYTKEDYKRQADCFEYAFRILPTQPIAPPDTHLVELQTDYLNKMSSANMRYLRSLGELPT